MICGAGCRQGSDPEWLWPWYRPAAAASIQPLAREPPYAAGVAQKRQKKKEGCVTLHPSHRIYSESKSASHNWILASSWKWSGRELKVEEVIRPSLLYGDAQKSLCRYNALLSEFLKDWCLLISPKFMWNRLQLLCAYVSAYKFAAATASSKVFHTSSIILNIQYHQLFVSLSCLAFLDNSYNLSIYYGHLVMILS